MLFWPYLIAAATAATAVPPATPPPSHGASDGAPDSAAEAQPILASDRNDIIIDAQIDYNKRMTVPVTIDGQGPFRFLIDTGAQATVITRGVTEQLNLLPTGSATIVAMGSRKRAQLVELDGLEFADRVFNNISAPLLEKQNVGADGILGLDSLQDMRVMIDFRDETISVGESHSLRGNQGYEIVVRARHKIGRLVITNAIIDGVKTAVILDTGAQTSYGNDRLRRKLRARNLDEVYSKDVNGKQIAGQRHFTKSLKIQRLELTNMSITFAESPVFAALGLEKRPAMILGMHDLRLFDRIAIDFATRQVLFDLPAGTKKVDNYYPTRL